MLFTDADTFYYNKFAVLETISLMQKERVDVVTGLPLIELRDFYSKLIMPLFNLFSILCAPSYSDLRNSKSNVGYLIGSFFIINKNVMDKIGGFRCVQSSIQEDTDLGVCLKKLRYSILVVKISHLVSAFWSRNRRTLLEGIKRIVSYNLSNSKKNILIEILVVFFLIVAPFLLLPFIGNLNKNQGGNVITMTLYFWKCLDVCIANSGISCGRIDKVSLKSSLFLANTIWERFLSHYLSNQYISTGILALVSRNTMEREGI